MISNCYILNGQAGFAFASASDQEELKQNPCSCPITTEQ